MEAIIYRIIYPLICDIGFVCAFLFHFKKMKKQKSADKDKMKIRLKTYFFLSLALFTLAYTTYLSLDLILQDYISDNGTYVRSYRGKAIGTQDLYFELDGSIIAFNMLTSEFNDYDLKKGKVYKLTYAKRTNTVIQLEGN